MSATATAALVSILSMTRLVCLAATRAEQQLERFHRPTTLLFEKARTRQHAEQPLTVHPPPNSNYMQTDTVPAGYCVPFRLLPMQIWMLTAQMISSTWFALGTHSTGKEAMSQCPYLTRSQGFGPAIMPSPALFVSFKSIFNTLIPIAIVSIALCAPFPR